MRRSLFGLSIALAAALLAAGCATDQGAVSHPGVSVTRFHLGAPIARGTIRVEPARSDDADSLAFAQLSAPVARELARLGWTVADGPGPTEQVATVSIERTTREGPARRSSVSIGIGGFSGGRHSGVGVGAGGSIPVGGARQSGGVTARLSVRIQRRSDATVAWEGRAELDAALGAPLAAAPAAVDRLAAALFQGFPGESGRTITVR
jgi:hypothetical protein